MFPSNRFLYKSTIFFISKTNSKYYYQISYQYHYQIHYQNYFLPFSVSFYIAK